MKTLAQKTKKHFNFKYQEIRYEEISMGYLFVMDTKVKSEEVLEGAVVTKIKKTSQPSLVVGYFKFSLTLLFLWFTCSFLLGGEEDLFDLTLFGAVLGLI